MKNTGVVRRLDELGRITLPMELRKVFNIEERDLSRSMLKMTKLF